DRRALEGVAVLVDVGREGRDAGDPEVPRGDRLAEPLPPRQEPATEAGIGVEQHAPFRGGGCQVSDGVDDAVRVAGRGADDEPGARADRVDGRGDVGATVVTHRYEDLLHVEVLRRLRERRVRGRRGQELRL